MSAKVLTKAEKSNTLSEKFKKVKVKLQKDIARNVFGDPTTLNCPKINEVNSMKIQEKLKNIFQFTPRQPIPWPNLKDLSKEERIALRKSKPLYRISPNDCNLVCGANQVIKAVEKREAKLVLLTDDFTPELLLKHVIQLCNLYNIPIAKVHNFRQSSKECFGFSAIASAFKKIKKTNPLYEVVTMIKTFLSVSDAEVEEIIEGRKESENMECENIEKQTDIALEETENKQINDPVNIESDEEREEVILYRDSINYRVFVPEKKKNEPEVEKHKIEDFIALVHDSEDEEFSSRKRKKEDQGDETNDSDKESEYRKETRQKKQEDATAKNITKKRKEMMSEESSHKSTNTESSKKMKCKNNAKEISCDYLPLKVKQIRKNKNRNK